MKQGLSIPSASPHRPFQAEKAHALRDAIPSGGLFRDKSWRIAPEPLLLPDSIYQKIVELGPRLHAFNKACNLFYRQSRNGKLPSWLCHYLDAGKPAALLDVANDPVFKNDLPHVIRPDLLVTEEGLAITELDSVPGGIGLTAWLQQAYSPGKVSPMLESFVAALGNQNQASEAHVPRVAIVISEEASDYRPEMEWLAAQNRENSTQKLDLKVCRPEDLQYTDGGVLLNGQRLDGIYRFFELFDLPNIVHAERLMIATREGKVRVAPPFKPQLEEKLWMALFWFPQLAESWRRELGDRYLRDLREMIPFTWLMDPAPLPPHAVIPQLEIQDWRQLAGFSQKKRDLVLKISGFSERAWGSRGVFVGSDMPSEDWGKVVGDALTQFESNPHILQRFAKTSLMEHEWYDFEKKAVVPMKGRLRLCPYYFVEKDEPRLGGILATLCPSDKKLIHGMQDAIITLAIPES